MSTHSIPLARLILKFQPSFARAADRSKFSVGALKYGALLAVLMYLPPTENAFANASSSHAAARQTIFKFLKERRDAFYLGDVDRFQKFEADEFTRVSEDGQSVTKQEQLEYLNAHTTDRKTSDARPIYSDDDLKLDVFGTVAVLTGILSETESSQAGFHLQRSRFTEIWLFRHGRWQTFHSHYTTIVP